MIFKHSFLGEILEKNSAKKNIKEAVRVKQENNEMAYGFSRNNETLSN